MVYLYFTMDMSEIRHMLYILPLDLLPNTHSQIENSLNVIVFAPYVLEKLFWFCFFTESVN